MWLFYPQKRPKNGSLNRDLLNFLNRYGIFWVPPGESSCPDGSEYVWQRGVGSLQGRVTAARSWPLFREEKNHLRRCCKNLAGRNFDSRAKCSRENFFMYARSHAALQAAELDWIVGPGYTSGGIILGCSQRLASCLRHSAWIGPDLLCHPSSVTHGGFQLTGSDDFSSLTGSSNWPFRWYDYLLLANILTYQLIT